MEGVGIESHHQAFRGMGKCWYSFHAGEDPMNSFGLRSLICFVWLAALAQTPAPKEMPLNNGSIDGGNTYHNPALSMTISLPGTRQFVDMTMYYSTEAKQKEKEKLDRARARCKGALCGPAEINVSFQSQSTPRPIYAISITGFRLSAEYQDRDRYPLKGFAETMSLGRLGDNWIPEGNLTAIRLGGRPAYRLIVHLKTATSRRAFSYVAESNGYAFLLLGNAISEPEKLQSAIEQMIFTNAMP